MSIVTFWPKLMASPEFIAEGLPLNVICTHIIIPNVKNLIYTGKTGVRNTTVGAI